MGSEHFAGPRDTARAMSEENVEIVRQPIAVRAQSCRHLDERLGLRFPRALALFARTIWGLPPRSRLRRWLVSRFARLGFEALNRGDHEAGLLLYHPDVESTWPPQLATVGVQSKIRGREERLRFQDNWRAEWGGLSFEIEQLFAAGDRVLVLGRTKGSGLSSRVPAETESAWVFTVSAGKVIREDIFLDHGEALEAAGLSE
jgi:ketosteroid isomerase-like protein